MGKQVAGRKRHIAVDTEGLLLVVHVQAGDVQERLGAKQVFATLNRSLPQWVSKRPRCAVSG